MNQMAASFRPSVASFVREKLNESGLTDKEVAKQLDCSSQWVRHFRSGIIKNPGVNFVEHLYLILTGKPLI